MMPPGWHVTTQTEGGVLYDTSYTAAGRFAVEAEIFIFPGASQEGYGVFAGGKDLASGARTFIAFLARTDGSTGVFRFSGTNAPEPLVDWTSGSAVLPAGSEAQRNTLRVTAEPDTLRFHANGTEVAKLARAQLPLDGLFGLRVGAGLNLHAANLDLTRRLAPVPTRSDPPHPPRGNVPIAAPAQPSRTAEPLRAAS
jgi:hypothetical protein